MFPKILPAIAEEATPQCDNIVGTVDAPVHIGLFQSLSGWVHLISQGMPLARIQNLLIPSDSFLSLIVFLPRPARDKLHRLRHDRLTSIVPYNKMNMVGGHRVIQDGHVEPLLRLKEPLQPSPLIARELQQEFLLVAPMREVSDETRKIMPVRSRQFKTPETAF